MERYNSIILKLLKKQHKKPHPRALLFLNEFDFIHNSQLEPLVKQCLETWFSNLNQLTPSDQLNYSHIGFAYEYKKLSSLFKVPIPISPITTHLLYIPKLLQYKTKLLLNPKTLHSFLTQKNSLSHPLFKTLLSVHQLCWSSIELGNLFNLPIPFIHPFEHFLTQLQPLNDHLYSLIINEVDSHPTLFPPNSSETFKLAHTLKKSLGEFEKDILMIGISKLDNGETMASFSAQSSSKAHKILCSVLSNFPHIIPSISTPDSRYFYRYIRLKEKTIKFHNGFSCVEPKLIQSASLLGRTVTSMSVIRLHDTGKRYDTTHTPILSKPCPGCLLNFNLFKLIH